MLSANCCGGVNLLSSNYKRWMHNVCKRIGKQVEYRVLILDEESWKMAINNATFEELRSLDCLIIEEKLRRR